MSFFSFYICAIVFFQHAANALSELAGNTLIPAGVLAIAGCLIAVLLILAFFFPFVIDGMAIIEKDPKKFIKNPAAVLRDQYGSIVDSDEWDRKRILAGGVSGFLAIGFFCAAILAVICTKGPAWGNVYEPMTPRFLQASAVCLISAVFFAVWLFVDYRLSYHYSLSVTRLIYKALTEDIQDDNQTSVCMKLLCTFLDYEVSEAALDDIYEIVEDHPDSEGGRRCIGVILNDFGPNHDTSVLSEPATNALALLKIKYEKYLPNGEKV